MKTTVLLSTFAAFFLLFNMNQTTSLRHTEYNIAAPMNTLTYIAAKSGMFKTTTAAKRSNAIATKVNVAQAKDLRYLKFDVAHFMSDRNEPAEATEANSYDYLKFDAGKYKSEKTETMELPASVHANLAFDANNYIDNSANDPENMELPVNEFEYLKFNANAYAASESANPETMQMPENDLSYLKFDANRYTNADDITELPEKDLSYLKFDVNNYTHSNGTNYELPIDEFSYLKFDATQYTTKTNTEPGNYGELPASE